MSKEAEVMTSGRAAGSVPGLKWNNIGTREESEGEPLQGQDCLDSDLGGDIWVSFEVPQHHAEETWAGPDGPRELSMVWWCWPKWPTSSCRACSSPPVVPGMENILERCTHKKSCDIWFSFAFLERKEKKQQGSVLAQLPCAQPAGGEYSVLAEGSVTPGCCSASQIFFRIFLPTPIALASLRASGGKHKRTLCCGLGRRVVLESSVSSCVSLGGQAGDRYVPHL